MAISTSLFATGDLFTEEQPVYASDLNHPHELTATELQTLFSLFTGHLVTPTLTIDNTGDKVDVTINALLAGVHLTGESAFLFDTDLAAGTYRLLVNNLGQCLIEVATDTSMLDLGSVAWNGTDTLTSLVEDITQPTLTINGFSSTFSATITDFKPLGAWVEGTAYRQYNIVSRTATIAGVSVTQWFYALANNTATSENAPPVTFGASNSTWRYMFGQGATGTAGNPATLPVERGTLAIGTAYNVRDNGIGTDGNKYQCLVQHTETADTLPVTGAEYATYWILAGLRGTTGDTGAAGPSPRDAGAWSALGVAYVNNDTYFDMVTHNDGYYKCLLSNTSAAGNEPGTAGGAEEWFLVYQLTPATLEINWLNAHTWAADNAYSLNDAYYQTGTATVPGGSVRCIQANTAAAANKPFFGANWTDYWAIIARDGAQGTDGLSPIMQGAYDAEATYTPPMMVRHNNASWQALESVTGVEPSGTATEWALVNEDGTSVPGPAGAGVDDFAQDLETTTGLTFGYKGGYAVGGRYGPPGSVVLSDNSSVNIHYAVDSTDDNKIILTPYGNAGIYQLQQAYSVTTVDGEITNVVDLRQTVNDGIAYHLGGPETRVVANPTLAGGFLTYHESDGFYTLAKHNLAATVAPTVDDDYTAGYKIHSKWYDTVTQKLYECVDDTEGAAVWVSLNDVAPRVVQVQLNGATALTTDDKAYFRVPAVMNGWVLSSVAAMSVAASSSGTPTFTVKNGSTAMLTTAITIDASETDSSTAAVAAVIDAANDDVSNGNQIEVACSVAGTGVTYAVVELTFTPA